MKLRYLIATLVVVFLGESLFVVPEVWGPGRRFLAAVVPALIVDYSNTDRVNSQQTALHLNPLLAQAAQLKAEDMASRSYFSHEGPNGETPWTWLDKVGYFYVYAGENLALDFYDSNEVNQAWMNSPKHRDNILNKDFTDIGVGIATGKFEGHDSVFIVQFFGSTQESLAKRDKTGASSLSFKPTNLLSAVVGLSDGVLSNVRLASLAVLKTFGYQPINGRVI